MFLSCHVCVLVTSVFHPLKLQISGLFRERTSLTFRQLWSVDSLWNTYVARCIWLHVLIMIRTCSQMHRADKYSQHSSIIWPVWLNGWAFVYEVSGCGFESRCSHLNFRCRVSFEQGVPWHSGNYTVSIHSDARTWHDKNIQSLRPVAEKLGLKNQEDSELSQIFFHVIFFLFTKINKWINK